MMSNLVYLYLKLSNKTRQDFLTFCRLALVYEAGDGAREYIVRQEDFPFRGAR